MKLALLVLAGCLCSVSAGAADLPPIVGEAVQLELDGRLGEALDRYRAALSTEPVLIQDEAASQPLTVWVLSKMAHLSIDLGYGEEAWDLGIRLLSAKNARASEAGTLVRMRIYRLQSRWSDAQKSFDEYLKAWPQSPPSPLLLSEEEYVQEGVKKPASSLVSFQRVGPALWTSEGSWEKLLGPADALGLTVRETVRLQVGAFKDWSHALTLINMLREKGWVPFTDVKTSAGMKLHIVYLISRQPQTDRARLAAQGLNSLP